jgi:hypothetical protein
MLQFACHEKGLDMGKEENAREIMDLKSAQKQRAEGVLALLHCPEAATKGWWGRGNLTEMLGFLGKTTGADMARVAHKDKYFNQDHRVTSLCFKSVTDYASFQAPANVYAARKARNYMTGVKLMIRMLQLWPGGVGSPAMQELPKAPAKAPGAVAARRRKQPPARPQAPAKAPARPQAPTKAPARKKPSPKAPPRRRARKHDDSSGEDSADSSGEDDDEDEDSSDEYSEHSEGEESSADERAGEDEEDEEKAPEPKQQAAAQQVEEEEEELSPYEQQRKDNIASNQRVLAALGLGDAESRPRAQPQPRAAKRRRSAEVDASMPQSEPEAEDGDASPVSPAAVRQQPAPPVPAAEPMNNAASFFQLALNGR